jgi:hypothetical protein
VTQTPFPKGDEKKDLLLPVNFPTEYFEETCRNSTSRSFVCKVQRNSLPPGLQQLRQEHVALCQYFSNGIILTTTAVCVDLLKLYQNYLNSENVLRILTLYGGNGAAICQGCGMMLSRIFMF